MFLSSSEATFATSQDHAECRAVIGEGSRTFFAASLLLPRHVRGPAYGLYAFCRLSDDAIDLEGGSLDALARLRSRLANIYDGRPAAVAADRVMADLVQRFAIPRALPEALLEGLAWDAEGRQYEDLNKLFDYAARVAGAVGAMMTLIMGVRAPDVLARACDLGIAMQLTNIARDVGEDARAGRLYLPRNWLRDAGLDPSDFVADPKLDASLQGIIARLIDAADALYARAALGIADLPAGCRPGILSAALLYSEIGREIRRLSFDSIAQRARISTPRKARLVVQALSRTPMLKSGPPIPPLDAVAFLVAAVASCPIQPQAGSRAARSAKMKIGARLLSVLEMFERLERDEQLGK
jgi:15-cis-phytoene synthase